MAPPNHELMELNYAVRLLAKTVDDLGESVDEVLEKQATILTDVAKNKEDIADLDEKVKHVEQKIDSLDKKLTSIEQKFELLPLSLAKILDDLIEKKTTAAFEDVRLSLNEMRNKLWSIKSISKQIRDGGTGTHKLPTSAQLAEWESKSKEDKEEKEDGLTIRKGKFRMMLPFSEGTWKVLKIVIYVVVSLAGVLASGGGIWALVDKLKHIGHE